MNLIYARREWGCMGRPCLVHVYACMYPRRWCTDNSTSQHWTMRIVRARTYDEKKLSIIKFPFFVTGLNISRRKGGYLARWCSALCWRCKKRRAASRRDNASVCIEKGSSSSSSSVSSLSISVSLSSFLHFADSVLFCGRGAGWLFVVGS